MTGAGALVRALEEAGVEVVFGLPGVHNLAAWEALRASGIRLVSVRHEQTAAYAADGYARATGCAGVALVTTGPGAANCVTATGEAHESGSPVVVIATDIPASLRREGINRGVLHETSDQAALFAPVTKARLVVAPGDDVRAALTSAAEIAMSRPPRRGQRLRLAPRSRRRRRRRHLRHLGGGDRAGRRRSGARRAAASGGGDPASGAAAARLGRRRRDRRRRGGG
jgi:glyoxylate carboligase